MNLARSLVQALCLAGALISPTAFADSACNKQPVPAASVQAVGRDMIVSGVPTAVLAVDFNGTPEDVTNQFRDFWTREDVPFKGQRGPSGLLLSALDGNCHYVLTIPPQSDSGHTKGLLSVMRLGAGSVQHQVPDSAISLPQGSRKLSDIESRDPGQAGRTWLLEMPGSAGMNAQQYRNQLIAQGWSSLTEAPGYQVSNAQQRTGSAVVMQRGNDRLDAVFSDRNEHTEAVVNATRSR